MGRIPRFETPELDPLAQVFLAKGYVIVDAENRDGLEEIRAFIADVTRRHLEPQVVLDDDSLLNNVHQFVDIDGLNGLRLAVINALRSQEWFRPTYYSVAQNALHQIVGNELVMQRGVGLSVQLPEDESSLLPIHTDVWDGDSPYEVVLWIPMVDCRSTKSMFILPLDKDRPHQAKMAQFQNKGSEALFQSVSAEVEYLTIPYGSVLLFSQTLMHGNRVNNEKDSRWSMNCRFKSAMSPYSDKKLGEFFEPITIRPATHIGLAYEIPRGFDE